jgi:hypothetical protein
MLRQLALTMALLAFEADAEGDPAPPTFAHLQSTRLACLGVLPMVSDCITLPSGYFLDEPTYVKLDNELRRLQDTETRLVAENASLRAAAQTWKPGWITLTTTLVVGIVAGVYIDHRL